MSALITYLVSIFYVVPRKIKNIYLANICGLIIFSRNSHVSRVCTSYCEILIK